MPKRKELVLVAITSFFKNWVLDLAQTSNESIRVKLPEQKNIVITSLTGSRTDSLHTFYKIPMRFAYNDLGRDDDNGQVIKSGYHYNLQGIQSNLHWSGRFPVSNIDVKPTLLLHVDTFPSGDGSTKIKGQFTYSWEVYDFVG